MKKFIAILFLLCTAFVAKAQQLPTDQATRIGHLPNGLTYYIRHNEYPKGQANFYIAQKVGSVLEEDEQRGLAHFLEHMCFNGTENFPGNSLIDYLETIGVKFGQQLNAYTSIDETVYNIDNVPTAREATIDSVLLILHDWSHNLTLSPEEIDKERGVIHEEWRTRSSSVMRILERQLPRLMSNSRPGNRLPIGTMEVIDNFKPETLRAYYEKWYRPDLQAIIVVGDLDVDRTEEQIKKLFEPIALPENPAVREYFSVPDNDEPIVVSDKDKEQSHTAVMVMKKHPQLLSDEQKNTLAGMAHSDILGLAVNMLNSRFDEMTDDPATPFLGASVDDGDFLLSKQANAFNINLAPKEGLIDEAMRAVMAEVYRAVKYGFTQSELDRARAEVLSRVESAYQNRDKRYTSNFVGECVRHFLEAEPMPGIEVEYQFYKEYSPQFTLAMVNEVLPSIVSLNDSNLVVLVLNPDKDGYTQPTEEQLLANVHAAQQMELTPYVDNVKNEPLVSSLPEPGAIVKERDCKFGFRELQLSNGVKVYMKKTDYKDNEIIMNAYSKGGTSRYSLEDRYTLSLMKTYIGSSGLGNFTRTELSKALAGIQAGCTPSLNEWSEGLSGSCVPKDIRSLFELAYLHFQPLRRDDATVQSYLNSVRQQLHNRHIDPMTAFQDSVQRTIYGRNPYLVIFEEEDLDKASYDRALQIYADRFADASDFSFYFIGNLDEDSIRTYACRYLANLPVMKRNDSPVETHTALLPGIRENRFTQKQEQPQCYALVATFNKVKGDRKQKLAANILGQVLRTRYLKTIREDMGAAYSVQATASVGRAKLNEYRAMLQVLLPVKPEMCDTSLVVVDRILNELIANGVTAEELGKIKEHELKNLDEAERLNSAWLTWFRTYNEEGVDSYTALRESIQGITSKDLQQMARLILKGKNRVTVVMLPE